MHHARCRCAEQTQAEVVLQSVAAISPVIYYTRPSSSSIQACESDYSGINLTHLLTATGASFLWLLLMERQLLLLHCYMNVDGKRPPSTRRKRSVGLLYRVYCCTASIPYIPLNLPHSVASDSFSDFFFSPFSCTQIQFLSAAAEVTQRALLLDDFQRTFSFSSLATIFFSQASMDSTAATVIAISLQSCSSSTCT